MQSKKWLLLAKVKLSEKKYFLIKITYIFGSNILIFKFWSKIESLIKMLDEHPKQIFTRNFGQKYKFWTKKYKKSVLTILVFNIWVIIDFLKSS